MAIEDIVPRPIGSIIPGANQPVTPGAEDMTDTPSFVDTLGAAFRNDNILFQKARPGGAYEPIDVWSQIKETPYEEHFDAFKDVRNQAEFDHVQRQIDEETATKQTLAAAPWYQNIPATLMANLTDPTVLLPGGAFVRGANGGFALARTAASVAAGAGAQSAVQETVLQNAQALRTWDESAISIGSSTLLGGLLGWGGAALLSRGEMRGAAAALDRQLGATGGDAAEIISDIKPKLIAAGMGEEEANANAAIVAARYATRAERLGEVTGADLYRADMAEVRGPGATADAVIDPAARTFLQSEVEDAIRAYHASPFEFDRFDIGKVGTGEGRWYPEYVGAQGHGMYFTSSPDAAEAYRTMLKEEALVRKGVPGRDAKVYEANLELKPDDLLDLSGKVSANPKSKALAKELGLKPSAIGKELYSAAGSFPGKPFDPQLATDVLKDAGFKGTKYVDEPGKPQNYVVFDDRLIQIIRRYQAGEAGPRGRITLSDNKAIIDLFKGADQSTFMHEAGHLWLDELVRDAARGNVPQAIKDDLGTVLRWLKVDKVEDIGRAQHEQWAQAFERYLAEGKAPSSALAQAFEKFKQWLTAIYKSLTDMGAPLSDDVRGVMDRLLATDDEIANALAGNVQFPHSVGAAAVTEPTTASLSIAGRVAGGVAAGTQRFNPGLRLMHSPSAASRNIATNLFEMAQYLAGNETGMPSPRAAETLIKQWDGGLIQSEQATKRLYAEFRKRTGGSYNMVDRVGDMFGSQRASFYEEVGRSMRRNDENPIPEIAAAAKVWRERVFDPLKEAAIKAGLLPPDVSVDTALSYFSRMWNTRRLQAEEFVRTDGGLGFKPTVENWVRQNFPTWKAAFERSAQRRIDPLQREIDDIEMAKLRRDEELKQRGEGELTGEDEGYIRQAIRIVQGGAPKPKDVETLTQFIRREGGLVEDGGELRHMGINNRSMPNFIRKEKRRIGASNKINGGGWDTDAMARHAWENGFFPEHSEPPSRVEFLDALSDDFNKRRAVVRQEDRDAFRLVDLVNRIQDDLARIGVEPTTGPRFSTSDEVKGVVKRIHDALNLEADDKIAKLKEAMVERQSKIDEEREIQFKGDVDEMARDIANEVWNTLTGRGSQGPRASFITVKARGPLKERTFNIPDGLVERWLESDVSLVGKRYTRTMAPDVELARKFGSPDMEEELAKIGEEYHRLRAAVGDNARKLTAIGEQEKQDLKDIRHVRDIIRDERSDSWHDYGKMVRVATALQYMLKMGQVVLSSLTEPVRVVAAKGLTPIMSDGFSALRNLDALKLSIKEAQAAGNIGDRAMASRTAGMYDIMDFYGSKGPIEKFIDNMTNVASHWNGIRLWTDFVKSIASTRIQNQILDYVSRLSELSAEEKRYLKFLSLSDTDAERIARLYEKHGENYDGVRVAATEEWTRGLTGSERAQAELAVEAYRAALNKDLDSMVVTRGAADLPSFANTPLGKVLFQFNTFNLASHQRVLLRGLQEGHARFLSGVVALSSMGMLQTYLTAIATNSIDKLPDPQKNPGWWISEGLDRSGFFSIPMYLANSAEKLTGINPIKRPITWAMGDEGRQGSQKNRNRNRGSVLGPTVGSINDALDVASIAETVYKGDPVSKAQQNAAERVLPYNSFVGVRQLLKFIINPPTE